MSVGTPKPSSFSAAVIFLCLIKRHLQPLDHVKAHGGSPWLFDRTQRSVARIIMATRSYKPALTGGRNGRQPIDGIRHL